MSGETAGYSEEDAILQAKLSLIETQKHCRHAQDWIMVVREWMALAECIRVGKPQPYRRPMARPVVLTSGGNHGTVRPEQAETDELQESGGQNS